MLISLENVHMDNTGVDAAGAWCMQYMYVRMVGGRVKFGVQLLNEFAF